MTDTIYTIANATEGNEALRWVLRQLLSRVESLESLGGSAAGLDARLRALESPAAPQVAGGETAASPIPGKFAEVVERLRRDGVTGMTCRGDARVIIAGIECLARELEDARRAFSIQGQHLGDVIAELADAKQVNALANQVCREINEAPTPAAPCCTDADSLIGAIDHDLCHLDGGWWTEEERRQELIAKWRRALAETKAVELRLCDCKRAGNHTGDEVDRNMCDGCDLPLVAPIRQSPAPADEESER